MASLVTNLIKTAVFYARRDLGKRPLSRIIAGWKQIMTKRQLGYLFIGVGITAVLALFAIDLVGAGQFRGIGPAQRLALLAAGLVTLIGLTLLPLGDKPA